MELRVDRVPASATWALRQAVLRPHQTVEQVAASDDDEPSTGYFAAIDEDGQVVGTVWVSPAPAPFPAGDDAPPGAPTWRLRGMATRADVRNRGIGRAVLDRALQHVSGHGGGLLWCYARLPAVHLYQRAGFVEHGDAWEEPDIGPHVVMWRMVRPAA